MRLSQSQSGSSAAQADSLNSGVKKESKAVAATDKLKASNFPASILRIGHWEVPFIIFYSFILLNTFILGVK